jgi:HNH endonuclease
VDEKMKGRCISYSNLELAFVKAHCTWPISDLHELFLKIFKRDDVSAVNLNALRKRNGWKTGRTGCFEKGNRPFNKGQKGWFAKGTEATRFVKGQSPSNCAAVGAIRTLEDGYLEMKMQAGMRKWVLLQRVVWERCNGAIPKAAIVAFIDGNKQNINIKNLTLYTRAQNMKRNTIHNYPKEIAQLVQLQGAISRQINKRQNHE